MAGSWTPDDNPAFRDLVRHIEEIISEEYVQLCEEFPGLTGPDYWDLVSSDENQPGDRRRGGIPPGEVRDRGNVHQLQMAKVQIANQQKGDLREEA